MGSKNKVITSINLNRKVHADLHASGVKNISHYIEGLIKKDLYDYSQNNKADDEQLKKLQDQLARYAKDWEAYERAERAANKKVTK